MKKRTTRKSKKGLAGILGAVFLFAIVFTTGATYFAFVTSNMQNLNTELLTRNSIENERILERYAPAAFLLSQSSTIGLNITNSGSVPIKVVAIIVSDSSVVTTLDGQPGAQTTPNLPFFINPSTSKVLIDTGITPEVGKTYFIKVLSDRGNIGQTTYPDKSSVAIVAASLIAKGVGDVQMSFKSLMWSTQQSTPLTWNDGGVIQSGKQKVIWKVELTNHSEKDVFLSNDCVLAVFRSGGSNTEAWYVVKTVSDSTGAITSLGSTEYIKVPANPLNIAEGGTPTTIYFAATSIGGSTPENFPSQADIWMVMIGLTGTYTSPGSSDSYAQLIPFKTIRAN